MFKKFWTILFLFWAFLAPFFSIDIHTAFAASKCDGVIISEIMPNPASPLSDSTDEWIELKNTTDIDIDISSCKLKDMAGSVKEYVMPAETVMSAKGFLVFYNRDTKISLNNDTDGAYFLAPDGGPVSQTTLYKNAPAGQSYALKGNIWEWTGDVTPGFEKSSGGDIPTDGINTCEGLVVSEIMPDPVSPLSDTNDEWIEIYNETNEPVNLGGCVLADTYKSGSTKEYKIVGEALAPGGFMVFYSKDTKISLNNTDGDSVRMLSSDKRIVFETQNYGKAQPGQSWAYDGDKWAWTVAPTAGALNTIEAPEEKSSDKSSATNKKSSAKSKSQDSKTKTKSKPVAKKSKDDKKGADSSDVLGASTEGEESSNGGKISDKTMGYVLVVLAGALLVGYVIYIKKDYIYENIIEKFRRDN